jgi:hypothetical protein
MNYIDAALLVLVFAVLMRGSWKLPPRSLTRPT